jgi:TRAP-type C4-dicarboxylate transport system permease small subunit
MKENRSFAQNILDLIQTGLTWAICILLSGLVIVVLSSVLSRYLLNFSIAWAEELSRFMLIWTVLMGMVVANAYGEHLGLDILIRIVTPKFSHLILIVSNLLILIAVGLMITGGINLAKESLDSYSPALGIPYGYVYAIVPLCGSFLFFQTLVHLAGRFKLFIGNNGEEAGNR